MIGASESNDTETWFVETPDILKDKQSTDSTNTLTSFLLPHHFDLISTADEIYYEDMAPEHQFANWCNLPRKCDMPTSRGKWSRRLCLRSSNGFVFICAMHNYLNNFLRIS